MDLLTALSLVGILFITLLVATCGYFVVSLLHLHAKYDHLPGPQRTSFFRGNLDQLLQRNRKPQECIALPANHGNEKLKPLGYETFRDWFNDYGDTYLVFILNRPMILTRDRNILKTILVSGDPKNFPKLGFSVRSLHGQRYLMDGLATAVDHDSWYIRRKIVDPAFHGNQLRNFLDAFNCAGDQLVSELQKYADSGEECSLAHLFQRTTVDVIIKAIFSMDATDLHSDFHEICIRFVNDSFAAVQLSHIPFIDFNPLYYNHIRKTRKLIQSFRDIGANVINARKSAICNDEVVPSDLLTTMVRAHLDPSTGYDFEIMVDDFTTIFIAGMETTSSTLSFMFMELGRRPDLLKRLLSEIDDVVGQKSFILNDDFSKLTFSSMLIKETLRKYTIAPMILRECVNQTTIDGIRLPAGSNIFLHLAAANNDERYLDNPEIFDPDRFDYQKEKRVPLYSFLSFSLGPRNCIGQVFAQMEMKVVIAKFFQHFTFKLDKGEKFLLGQRTTVFPISGVKCTVSAR